MAASTGLRKPFIPHPGPPPSARLTTLKGELESHQPWDGITDRCEDPISRWIYRYMFDRTIKNMDRDQIPLPIEFMDEFSQVHVTSEMELGPTREQGIELRVGGGKVHIGASIQGPILGIILTSR